MTTITASTMAPMMISTSTRVIEIPLSYRDPPPTGNGLSIFPMFRSKQARAHLQDARPLCAIAATRAGKRGDRVVPTASFPFAACAQVWNWHPDDLADATTLVRNLGVNCRASKSVGHALTLKQSDSKLSSAIQLPLQSSNFLQAPSRHLILCWHQRRPRVV